MAGRAGGTVSVRRAPRSAPTKTPAAAAGGTTGTPAVPPTKKTTRPAAAAPSKPPTGSGGTGTGGSAPAGDSRSYRFPTTSGGPENVAGFLLALLVWGWVVMPFLEGGTTQVRRVLKAKFTNKALDGTWLP